MSHSQQAQALEPNSLRKALRRLLDAKKDGYSLVASILAHSTADGLDTYAKALEVILRTGEISPEARYSAFRLLYDIRDRDHAKLTDMIQQLHAETCKKLIAGVCASLYNIDENLGEPWLLINLHVERGGRPTDSGALDAVVEQVAADNEVGTVVMRLLAPLGVFGPSPSGQEQIETWLSELCIRVYQLAAKRAEAAGDFSMAAVLRTRCGEKNEGITPLYALAMTHHQPVDLTRSFNTWPSGNGLFVRPAIGSRRPLNEILKAVFGTDDIQDHELLRRDAKQHLDRHPGYAFSEGVISVGNPVAQLIVERLLAQGRWSETCRLLNEERVRHYCFDQITINTLLVPAFFEAMKQGRLAVAAALGQIIRRHNQRRPFSPTNFPYGDSQFGRSIYECANRHFHDRQMTLEQWERRVCRFEQVEHDPMDGGSSSWREERVTPRPADLEAEFGGLEAERCSWMNELAGSILTKADALMRQVIEQRLVLELNLT